ncbi:MAG TPA: hypothetical protein VH413_10645 [Verrucomicrobiae bacterium]|jgi:hypothetical protein|nr:hypothetical protein [Verrucomicrobiae bacterium]
MSDIPKNKSEKNTFPIGIVLVLVVFTIAVLFFVSKAIFGRHQSSVPMTNITPIDGVPAAFVPKAFIDLHSYFNGSLKTNWMSHAAYMQDRNLADLPAGVNVFNGSTFRVDGLIQLQGAVMKREHRKFPEQVTGIPVGLKCADLHFMQGTGWSITDGAQLAAYMIHFADGTQVEFPVLYGTDVRDWNYYADDKYQATNAVWSSQQHPVHFRLYAATWHNPKPELEVKSIDFVSLVTGCAPFCLAITAE